MKNKLLHKSDEQDVFTDLLFNALLGFAFMFAIAFMLINSSEDSGKIESKAIINQLLFQNNLKIIIIYWI